VREYRLRRDAGHELQKQLDRFQLGWLNDSVKLIPEIDIAENGQTKVRTARVKSEESRADSAHQYLQAKYLDECFARAKKDPSVMYEAEDDIKFGRRETLASGLDIVIDILEPKNLPESATLAYILGLPGR
jgi:hypothetical protein